MDKVVFGLLIVFLFLCIVLLQALCLFVAWNYVLVKVIPVLRHLSYAQSLSLVLLYFLFTIFSVRNSQGGIGNEKNKEKT